MDLMQKAVMVVVEHEGKVLMIRRAQGRPAAGYWSPPSGKIDPGEAPEQAAARELREETGLEAIIGEQVHRCLAEGAPFELHWYRARLVGGELRLKADEVEDARWCSRDEVLSLSPLFAATRAFFERTWT